jgi:four helix bundle protein
MQKNSIVGKKAFDFAKQIVLFHMSHSKSHPSLYPLFTQLLKSGTAIGANIEEGLGGYSDKDLMAKFGIALKEVRETRYWLRLFIETVTLKDAKAISLLNEATEILKMITAIIKTIKARSN